MQLMGRDRSEGRTPARLAAYLLSLTVIALALDFYVIDPGRLFRVASLPQAIAFAAVIAVWLLLCFLAERLFRQMHEDRKHRHLAERASERAASLAQLTAALAQARTPRLVIEAAVQEPLHALNADRGQLLLVARDGASAEVARAVGFSDEIPEPPNLAAKSPVSDAIGRGAAVIVESLDAWNAEYPELEPKVGSKGFNALIAVPVLIGSRVVAIAQLEFEKPRTFGPEEREYLAALTTSAAQAFDRTWQLESAERARTGAEALRARADAELVERREIEHALRASETRYRALATRTSRLHSLSAALSEAVTLEAVARAVVQHGRTVVGAIAGDVTLLAEKGTQFELLYAHPEMEHEQSPAQRPTLKVEEGLVASEVVRSGKPVFIRSLAEWQERYWRSATTAADEGYESSAAMPLLVEGAPVGVLTFYFAVPVNFDDDFQALLLSVAQHCVQALDRARLYESTQRARSDAEKANRLKDEFVSIVSHELRTPLNAILGWATMLQRGALSSEKSSRAVQAICDNASRQARLIEELLDFSRVSAGRTHLEMRNLDVRELIRGVFESMSPTAAARGVELASSPVPPVWVSGDMRRLEQVFFNLIDNALKFTPASGHVHVDTRLADGRVEIQVRDDGAGIEPDVLPVVFDRFRQGDSSTSRAYGGLGLGLSIAKQLIEAHGGSISAQSAGKGRGSTLTVQLPIVAGLHDPRLEEPVLDRPRADLLEPRLDGLRVLVVDDEPDAREIMAHTLETAGATVTLAASAADALRILDRAELDVLLADIAMPEEDGFSLIRKVRSSPARRVAGLPAAAVTAFTREEHLRDALSAGFHLHLAKPVRSDELVRAVDQLVRRTVH